MSSTIEDPRSLELSRPFGVAEELQGQPIDREAVLARTAILTAGLGELASLNGQWCFFDAARLLTRVAGRLEVVLPPDAPSAFTVTVAALVDTLWSQGTVAVVSPSKAGWQGATATLCVGSSPRQALDPIVIGNAAWLACLGTIPGERHLPSHANPVSAMLAASLGVAEVFKRLYGISEDKAPRLHDEQFNLFTMSAEHNEAGPELPATIQLPDTLLLGAGAIGNAIALLLTQLSIQGRVVVLDKDVYGPENRGTCMLLDEAGWQATPKAPALAGFMKETGRIEAKGLHATIEDSLSNELLQGYAIDLVLGALDDVGARREVQRLWPALLVDGGINSLGAAAIAHRAGDSSSACMRCTFPLPVRRVESLSTQERELHAGRRTVCANLAEADAQKALGINLAGAFRPSVPFVASASAALVMAQAIKGLLWPQEPLHGAVQVESLFLGFATAQRLRRKPSYTCECVLHKAVISGLVQQRTLQHAQPVALTSAHQSQNSGASRN